jgi:hypothetical protein
MTYAANQICPQKIVGTWAQTYRGDQQNRQRNGKTNLGNQSTF